MKEIRTVVQGLAAGLLLSATLTAAAQAVRTGVVYTTDRTGTYRGDLYLPGVGKTPPPVLVMIHGGSWMTGDSRKLQHLAEDLAHHGIAGFSIDYDLHPRSFPVSWQECRAAVLYLRAHAAELGIDPNRIGVMGESAGGQLAALLATAPEGPAQPVAGAGAPTGSSVPAPHTVVPVALAVIFNGGYDVHPRSFLLKRYLGGRCEQIPEVCNDASPDNHVRPGLPPMFVGHGSADGIIPYTQAEQFIGLLRAAGDPVTPYIAVGAGHSYWKQEPRYSRNMAAVYAFLQGIWGVPAVLPTTP